MDAVPVFGAERKDLLCMVRWVSAEKGTDLNEAQRDEVMNAFPYRPTICNERMNRPEFRGYPLVRLEVWLAKTRFWITKAGNLAAHSGCHSTYTEA